MLYYELVGAHDTAEAPLRQFLLKDIAAGQRHGQPAAIPNDVGAGRHQTR